MTPNEITTLLAMNLDKELDIPFRLQMMKRVNYWRSRMIANSVGKAPSQRKFFRQALYLCMETKFVNNCVSVVGEKQSITTEPIPQLIRIGSVLFDYVGGIDGKSPFREVNPGTQNYLMDGKFSDKFPTYEYTNRYIISDKRDIPKIRVDGIFDDPMFVSSCNCTCLSADCNTWDVEYPCSGDILQLVIQSILQIDYNRNPTDKTNPEIPVT